MKAVAFTDGACNVATDGRGGYGLLLHLEDGRKYEQYGGMGIGRTNNQAEYKAVRMAMIVAKMFDVLDIVIFSDSNLVVQQMSGRWKINRPLRSHYEMTANYILRFRTALFRWIPREANTTADKLSKMGLNLKNGSFARRRIAGRPFTYEKLFDEEQAQ